MLRLTKLSKRFGSVVAVDELSLEARRGEILGFLGPNGAGKTTTVGMVAGLIKPDGGHVALEGVGTPDQPATRYSIGVAPQALAVYEDLTAEENLLFFGQLALLQRSRLRERIAWCLDFVRLTERSRDRVKTFSGGMKRRLNLAVALIHDPPLLLLDEPTAGVDPQSRHVIFEKILELKSSGRAILYTTHYMEEAQRLCDRVGIIDHGQLLALDEVERLIDAHGGKSVVTAVRKDSQLRIESTDPIGEVVKLQGADDVVSLRIDRPNLERVFLNLTGRGLRD